MAQRRLYVNTNADTNTSSLLSPHHAAADQRFDGARRSERLLPYREEIHSAHEKTDIAYFTRHLDLETEVFSLLMRRLEDPTFQETEFFGGATIHEVSRPRGFQSLHQVHDVADRRELVACSFKAHEQRFKTEISEVLRERVHDAWVDFWHTSYSGEGAFSDVVRNRRLTHNEADGLEEKRMEVDRPRPANLHNYDWGQFSGEHRDPVFMSGDDVLVIHEADPGIDKDDCHTSRHRSLRRIIRGLEVRRVDWRVLRPYEGERSGVLVGKKDVDTPYWLPKTTVDFMRDNYGGFALPPE